MIFFVAAAAFFALFVLQTSVFGMFGGWGPDAALLAAIFFGVRHNKYPGLQAGILAGLLQDASSHGIIGINLLAKGLCGLASGWLMENHLVDWKDAFTWIALIFIGTAFNQFVVAEYFSAFYDLQTPFWPAFWKCIGQSLINITAGIVMFSALLKIEPLLGGRRSGFTSAID